jgi:hypothetical protein
MIFHEIPCAVIPATARAGARAKSGAGSKSERQGKSGGNPVVDFTSGSKNWIPAPPQPAPDLIRGAARNDGMWASSALGISE